MTTTTQTTQARHSALITRRQKLTAEAKARKEQPEESALKSLDRKISACSHLLNPATQKPRKPRAKLLLAEASRLAFS